MANKLKVVFLGTPEFGATVLRQLAKEFDVVLAVTQPDKEVGRKRILEESPVKKLAKELGIEVFQPVSIRKEYEYILNNYDFDIIVSAAYGQIVGTKLLFHPKYKAINVHGSLLPAGRGGAPIQRSIMNGDKVTGITIMYMEKGMDTGAILRQEKIDILDTDTSESLFKKLADLGASMINDTIYDLVAGKITPIAQDDEKATFTYALTKEDEHLDFNKSAFLVNCQIRGLGEHIGATFSIDGMNYKVYSSTVINEETNVESGHISYFDKKKFRVACADHKQIEFNQIKPEGKNLMNFSDFYNGQGRKVIELNKEIG